VAVLEKENVIKMKTIDEMKRDFDEKQEAGKIRAERAKLERKQEEDRKRVIEKIKADIEKIVIAFFELRINRGIPNYFDYYEIVEGIGPLDHDELIALDEFLRDNNEKIGHRYMGEDSVFFLRKQEIHKKQWWQFWR